MPYMTPGFNPIFFHGDILIILNIFKSLFSYGLICTVIILDAHIQHGQRFK